MSKTNFESYLEAQLEDPVVKAEFDAFGAHIRSVQVLMAHFDARRVELGINKTDIAKQLNLQPSNVRRWFTAQKQNPSFASMVELADCLDLEIKLVPKNPTQSTKLTEDSARNSQLQVS
jgi:hypothetical protein